MITEVYPAQTSVKILQRNDVILAMDGIEVATDGTIQFREGERVSFRALIARKHLGDTCSLLISRNGGTKTVELKLEKRVDLVPRHLHDELPSYFVYGGLVFTPLSRPYLTHEYGKEWWKVYVSKGGRRNRAWILGIVVQMRVLLVYLVRPYMIWCSCLLAWLTSRLVYTERSNSTSA